MTLDLNYQKWWERHRAVIIRVLAVIMAIVATLKLGDEFCRLTLDHGSTGAVDLRHMHRWIGIWFSGQSLFQNSRAALYPPATYLMLWPLMGWISFTTARWLWAGLFIILLFLTSFFLIRASGAKTPAEKIFVVLLFLSINGTGVAVGSGQFILLILPALLAALLLIERDDDDMPHDVMAGALVAWTLVKPSVALPFIWVFLFRRRHWRAVVIAVVIYTGLTVASAAVQKETLPALLQAMFHRTTVATTSFPGTRNLHAVLTTFGLAEWMTLSSVIVFFGFGCWVFSRRDADLWILTGLAALIARMWTYHRVYDDALIILAELALWRIARTGKISTERAQAEILVVSNAFLMLCPARFLDYEHGWTVPWLCITLQSVAWLVTAIFLAARSRSFGIKVPA